MDPDARTDHVDERGVLLTAEGRRRARAELDQADARDPQEREQALATFRARLAAATTGR